MSKNGNIWSLGLATTALLIGTSGIVWAQPPAGGADTGTATGRTAKHAKGDKKAGGKNKGAMLITPQQLKKVWGQPLTDEQQKGVDDAAKTYTESIAKALGTTVEDLQAKARAARKDKGDNKKGNKTAPAAP